MAKLYYLNYSIKDKIYRNEAYVFDISKKCTIFAKNITMEYRVKFYEGYECEADVEASNPEEAIKKVLNRDFTNYEETDGPSVTMISVFENQEKADKNEPLYEANNIMI